MNPRNSSVRSAGWAALLVVAAVMLGCGGGSSGTTTGPVVTTFTPASPIVDGSLAMRAGTSAGSTITIKVSATQIPSFFGAAFYVTYNPSVLRFNGMDSAGSFLLAGVSASDVVFLADNATPGTVKVVASRLDPTTAPAVPVTTTADLLTLSFSSTQAIPPGSATGVLAFGDPKQVCDGTAAYPTCTAVPGITWIGGSITSTQ